jgi:hypothetical protein
MLTNEQENKIESNRKKERPSYYNAALQTTVVISKDFEGFLILLDDALKTQTITYLKSVKKENTDKKDRDELISLAISNEISDAEARYGVLDAQFSEFSTYRSGLIVENFEEVNEIGLLISDLQYAMGENLLTYDRMTHLKIFYGILKVIFNAGEVTDDVLKEIDSWIEVINAYKGLGV